MASDYAVRRLVLVRPVMSGDAGGETSLIKNDEHRKMQTLDVTIDHKIEITSDRELRHIKYNRKAFWRNSRLRPIISGNPNQTIIN